MHSISDIEAAGGYRVVYADPAWSYDDRGVRGGTSGHYEAVALKALAGLRVPEIAAPDCALFLWATFPLLPEALWLTERWGFTFKNCAFLWVKTTKAGDPSMGLGHWTRGNGEPCLLAIRGKPERLGKGVAQIVADAGEATFLGPRGRHSEKPAEVRTRIVELLGDVPRIELFARARSAGWDAWGNEVPGGSDIEL